MEGVLAMVINMDFAARKWLHSSGQAFSISTVDPALLAQLGIAV